MDFLDSENTIIDYIKSCIEHDVLEKYDKDVILSSYECWIEPLKIETLYFGKHENDEDFVRQLLDNQNLIPKDLPEWLIIDWKETTENIMTGFTKHNKHYFIVE